MPIEDVAVHAYSVMANFFIRMVCDKAALTDDQDREWVAAFFNADCAEAADMGHSLAPDRCHSPSDVFSVIIEDKAYLEEARDWSSVAAVEVVG